MRREGGGGGGGGEGKIFLTDYFISFLNRQYLSPVSREKFFVIVFISLESCYEFNLDIKSWRKIGMQRRAYW